MGEPQEPIVITGNVLDLPRLAWGTSSWVFEVSDSAVIKLTIEKNEGKTERAIYERLGSHPCITKLLFIHEGMVVLERLKYPLRQRLMDLREAGQVPSVDEVLRWASQAASGLHHLHSRGVLHVDIGGHNVLLDADDNLKLADFSGSSIDGSCPARLCGIRAEHPSFPADNPSVHSEIFAFGSLLYEMETTNQPYHEISVEEVEKLHGEGQFANTQGLFLHDIITKCWTMEYKNVGDVLADIERHIPAIASSKPTTPQQQFSN